MPSFKHGVKKSNANVSAQKAMQKHLQKQFKNVHVDPNQFKIPPMLGQTQLYRDNLGYTPNMWERF